MGDSMPLLRKSSCSMFLLSPYVPEREAGMERRSNVGRVPPKDVVDKPPSARKAKTPAPTGRVGFSNSARSRIKPGLLSLASTGDDGVLVDGGILLFAALGIRLPVSRRW